MIRRFISYYKPHKKLFFLDMVCAFIVAVCDLFYPMIARDIINEYVPNQLIRPLVVWSLVLLAIYIVKLILNYVITYYGHIVGIRIQADMRRDMFVHLQKLPFTYYDDNKSGAIMSRLINDLFEVSELAHHGPEDLFLSAIMFVGSFVFLLTINVYLSLILFAFLPLIMFFTIKMRLSLKNAFKKSKEQLAEVNADIETSVSGIRVSRAYTSEEHETRKFEHENDKFKAIRAVAMKEMGKFHSVMTFSTDFLYFVVLLGGGLFFYYGMIDIGDFAAFILFISMFLNPIKRFIALFEQLQEGMTGFARFCEVMDTPIEPESPNAVELTDVKGHIIFDDATFRYDSGSRRIVINHLNMDIPSGKKLALVGPSGGGKTTICNLIPRFYELKGGRITVDGHDITSLTRHSLRSNIGIVSQDVYLFNGTIKENIAYGDLDATDEEIIEAAKKANIHDYIMSLENGYDTDVGERGVKLSGGQKQRISIARVFLKNPSILILDEATSALDNATEMQIQSALDELAYGRTVIVVAHRLSTVKNADEIVVIDASGVKERGTHDQLMALNGEYSKLYSYQFR
ncbi:MAG: ABC transporter ATP-binding protein/permease [Clostridia bacterium]|nr:ABC transporter ATP-binding protein/permease [Clostridia bacterium]